MSKIDWTKPIELEDGTPVMLSKVCGDDEFCYEISHRYGLIYYNKHGECIGEIFPDIRNVHDLEHDPEPGTPTGTANATDTLTVRDRFAIAVMSGIAANPSDFVLGKTAKQCAEMAYKAADAMMEARKK